MGRVQGRAHRSAGRWIAIAFLFGSVTIVPATAQGGKGQELGQGQGRGQERDRDRKQGGPDSRASEETRQKVKDRMRADFDVSKQAGKVRVGRKGGTAKEFDVSRSVEGRRIALGLTGGGQAAGQRTDFSYDEETGTIRMTSTGQSVEVTIASDNTVTVGSTNCPGTDLECIGAAVTKAMPKLDSEEMAAVVFALEDDLSAMKNGTEIVAALTEVAARIGARGRKPPKHESDSEIDKLDAETRKQILEMRKAGKNDEERGG